MYEVASDLDYPSDLSAWAGLDDEWYLTGVYRQSEEDLEDDVRSEAKALLEATPKRYF